MNKIKELIKNSKFWKIYFCSIGVFLCLLIVGMIVFSFWLADYESSQNTVEVDRIITLFENKEYSEILNKTDVVMTGFVSKEEYEAKLRDAIEGKKITYVKAFSYDRFASPAFTVKADGEDLCRLTLKKAKETSTFGFSLYEFDCISDFSFADVNVVILAPETSTPYIDGKAVDGIFRQELAKDQPEATERVIGASKKIFRYEVCGLLSAPENIEVRTDTGELLEVENNSNNEIVAKLLNVTINAPAGFEVSVNGNVLTEKYTTGKSEENQYLQYMLNDEDKSSLALLNTYEVNQLVNKPEVKVKDNSGNFIECTYNAQTQTFDVGFKVYTFKIPSNYTVSVNGKEITASDNWVTEKDIPIAELSNIPTANFTAPVMNTYKVAVVSGELNIAAKNYKGDAVSLKYDESSMTYFADFAVADSQKSYFEEIAVNGAKKYAGFMSNDISMSTFLSGIISGTQMYKDMSEYRQYWYTDHDSTKFENIEAYDLKVYGENCFSCAVYFDYWIFGQRGKPDFQQKIPTNTRIWYVNRNGTWYMADIEIFDKPV
ncbi:MAG: hypothetical protein E7387_05545 [Ruminococcaceae bacterium]|nr:hypothetical protein [Oscillospiraceae bacterium]